MSEPVRTTSAIIACTRGDWTLTGITAASRIPSSSRPTRSVRYISPGHRKRATDDSLDQRRYVESRQIIDVYDAHVGGVRARLEPPAHGPAQVIEQHVMVADPLRSAALLVEQDPIEHVNHTAYLDDQPGLLAHLTRDALCQRLTDLQRAARQAPLAGLRLEPPLHQHN